MKLVVQNQSSQEYSNSQVKDTLIMQRLPNGAKNIFTMINRRPSTAAHSRESSAQRPGASSSLNMTMPVNWRGKISMPRKSITIEAKKPNTAVKMQFHPQMQTINQFLKGGFELRNTQALNRSDEKLRVSTAAHQPQKRPAVVSVNNLNAQFHEQVNLVKNFATSQHRLRQSAEKIADRNSCNFSATPFKQEKSHNLKLKDSIQRTSSTRAGTNIAMIIQHKSAESLDAKYPNRHGMNLTQSQEIPTGSLRAILDQQRPKTSLKTAKKEMRPVYQSAEFTTLQPTGSTLHETLNNESLADDMVTLTAPAGDYMIPRQPEKRSQTALGSRRKGVKTGKKATSIGRLECNTISGYTAPTADHAYYIKHGLKFSGVDREEEMKKPSNRYIDKIIERAKSQVDPRKYTDQADWRQKSLNRPNLAFSKKPKLTFTHETIIIQKKLVGPSSYQVPDKRRILGSYNDQADCVSHIDSHKFVKSEIPAPTKYESQGKSMSQLSKERSDRILYTYDKSHGLDRMGRIKKDDVPGPTTYEATEALDKSALTKLSIRQSIPKTKNINHIKALLAQKRTVPGVGHYQTANAEKQKSIPTTSMRIKRH